MTTRSGPAPEQTAKRAEFYKRLDGESMAPLWENLHSLVPPEPVSPAVAVKWDYDGRVRPFLMEAGQLITAKEAERRVLVLENPGLRGKASATHSLYAGLQLILPGEVAPAHRHSQSALRFIIEGLGAYTAVEGERTIMAPGDFVITPSWTWHDHGNPSDQPMVWLDVLDIPTVAFFDAGFAQSANADTQMETRPAGDAYARYGGNLAPVDWKPDRLSSPVFNYPYARSREILSTLEKNGDPDPHHGHKLRYVNPATGGSPMPTIGAFIQLLPKGFAALPYRSTDGAIYTVVEGEGETRIGDTVIAWKPRDVFIAPPWAWHAHRSFTEAVLFSASDRPAQESLGLWRDQKRTTA